MNPGAQAVVHPSRWSAFAADIVGGPSRLRIVALLAAVMALSSADIATVGAIAGSLERDLHVGNTEIGLLVTLSTAVTALATLPMGALADRVNRTQLLFWGVLAWSVVMVLNGASVDFAMLLVTRLGLGIVMAVANPVVASLTGDWFPVSERGRIYGFVLSGELVGAGIGYVVSGDVAEALSWRYAFWVLSLIGFVLAWFIRHAPEPARGGASRLAIGARDYPASTPGRGSRFGFTNRRAPAAHQTANRDDARRAGATAGKSDSPDDTEDPLAYAIKDLGIEPLADPPHRMEDATTMWQSIRAVLSIRTNLTLIIASSFGYFFFSGVETFGSLFIQVRFGVAEGLASVLLVVVGAGAVVGALSGGRVADRMLKREYIPARPVVAGGAFLFSAVLFVPSLLIPTLAAAGPLIFLAAAGYGATNPPLDAARLDLISQTMWGRAEAVRTVFRSAFSAVAPLLFGYLSTVFGEPTSGLGAPEANGSSDHGQGLDYTFLIMLAPMIIAGIMLVIYARRTYPRDVATELHEELMARSPRRTAAAAS